MKSNSSICSDEMSATGLPSSQGSKISRDPSSVTRVKQEWPCQVNRAIVAPPQIPRLRSTSGPLADMIRVFLGAEKLVQLARIRDPDLDHPPLTVRVAIDERGVRVQRG